MRVSDRLELISKIGRELQSRYTFDQLHSYLLAFEIPFMINGPSTSKWSYTKAVLDTQRIDKIIAIGEDLEIGFALGRGIKVISLKMGEDPTGFISVRQALPRRNRTAEEIAIEINNLLLDDTATKQRLEDANKP